MGKLEESSCLGQVSLGIWKGVAMYKSIKIANFRCITELEVDDLARVNLVVGKNNCGKTTFLEAVFLLLGAMNPQLPININRFRGLQMFSNTMWNSFFHNLDPAVPINIEEWTEDNRCQQRLTIMPVRKDTYSTPPGDIGANGSSLTDDTAPAWELNGLEFHFGEQPDLDDTVVSTVFEKDGQIVMNGSKKREVSGFFVSPATESDWGARFDGVQHEKRTGELISVVQKIEPNLSDLRLNAVGLLLGDIGLPRLMPVTLFGGGTKRVLSIAMAMLDAKGGCVLIDEIETGLHYSAQEALWRAIIAWADQLDVQVFVTTHSYECIKAFRAAASGSLFTDQSKLFRIERQQDDFKAITYHQDELERSIERIWEVR